VWVALARCPTDQCQEHHPHSQRQHRPAPTDLTGLRRTGGCGSGGFGTGGPGPMGRHRAGIPRWLSMVAGVPDLGEPSPPVPARNANGRGENTGAQRVSTGRECSNGRCGAWRIEPVTG
jgi:hypothetical protein